MVPRVPPILVSAASLASGQQIKSESPGSPEGSGHLGLGLSPSNRVPAAGGPPGTPQIIGGAGDGFGPRTAIALGRGSSSSRARFSRTNYNNVTLLRRKSLMPNSALDAQDRKRALGVAEVRAPGGEEGPGRDLEQIGRAHV